MRTHSVEPTAADRAFEAKKATYNKARSQLALAAQEVVILTTKQLARVAGSYASDRDLSQLVLGLRSGISSRNLNLISEAVNRYVGSIADDRRRVDFTQETTTSLFITAVLSLQDALNNCQIDLPGADIEDAHADTVRARASLNKLEVWGRE